MNKQAQPPALTLLTPQGDRGSRLCVRPSGLQGGFQQLSRGFQGFSGEGGEVLSEVGLTMHWSTPPPPVPSGVRSGQEQEAGDRRQEAGGRGGRRREPLSLAPGSQRCGKERTK